MKRRKTNKIKSSYTTYQKGKKVNFDFLLLIVVVLLSLFGLLMIFNASVVEAYNNFSDKYYFVKQQAIWFLIGLFTMFVFLNISPSFLKKFAVFLFSVSIVLLIFVLIPPFGVQIKGARRWINLGFTTVQPAELIKLTLTLYLATYLEKKRSLIKFIAIVAVIGGLIMLEPDLGTTLVITATATSIYFLSGASLKYFITLAFSGILAAVLFILSSEYRRARVSTYFNPTNDPLGASYHIRQVLIALGSGGFWGLGLGQSRQKYEYIPAATTDSIFAIIAEEAGFIGSLVVILLLAFLVVRAFSIAKYAKDLFAKLLAGGIASWLGIQIALNLATMVALVPLTGVPLPFISYGGSSTIINLAGIGILLGISRYEKD